MRSKFLCSSCQAQAAYRMKVVLPTSDIDALKVRHGTLARSAGRSCGSASMLGRRATAALWARLASERYAAWRTKLRGSRRRSSPAIAIDLPDCRPELRLGQRCPLLCSRKHRTVKNVVLTIKISCISHGCPIIHNETTGNGFET